jgi:hypothetical protein
LEPLAPSPYASVIYSATRTRSKGGPKQPGDHRVSQACAAHGRRIVPAWAGPTLRRVPPRFASVAIGLAPSGPLRSSGGPGSPFGPRPLGTGAKGNKAITECQTTQNCCDAILSNGFSQVVGGLAPREKIVRVTNKTARGHRRAHAALLASVRWGTYFGWPRSAGSPPPVDRRRHAPSYPTRRWSSQSAKGFLLP